MEGKVVIVTGSTDGIGRVIALHLLKRGARVVFHGRSVDKLREFDYNEENWLAIAGDISNENDCKSLVELTISKFDKQLRYYHERKYVSTFTTNIRSIVINEFTYNWISPELCFPHLTKTRGKILNVNSLTTFFTFIQHKFAEITKLAYEQFNRHCIKAYPQINVQLLDPCLYFEKVLYLSDLCFTYKQQLHQWVKANGQLEKNGNLEKLACHASVLIKQ